VHSHIAVTSDAGLTASVFYAEGIGSRSVGLSEVLSYIYKITSHSHPRHRKVDTDPRENLQVQKVYKIMIVHMMSF